MQGGGTSEDGDLDRTTASQHCYAAVIENRAKEVGVAVLDLSNLSLHITQHIEAGRLYTTTQLLLDACQPRQLVIVGSNHHEVAGAAGVNQVTAAAWAQVPLPRSAFDDTKGILAVEELTGWSCGNGGTALAEASAAEVGQGLHKSHYLGFGAAGALLQYVRRNLVLALSPGTVQVNFEGIKHHMALDRDAVTSLEILAPTKSTAALHKAVAGSTNSSVASVLQRQQGQSSGINSLQKDGVYQPNRPLPHGTAPSRPLLDSRTRRAGPQGHKPSISARTSSLFGFLNHCSTTCGARLLRTNLLQPLTNIPTLELRLDSLQELLESPHLTLELISLMDTLPKNLDKVCSNLAVRPANTGNASSRDPSTHLGRLVSAVILLRNVLRCLPVMADSMAWVDSDLLKAIKLNLGQEQLQQLLKEVEAVVDDDAQASKAQFVNKVQQCFAVRAQVDSFLDISRATFTRLTEQIHELAAKYRSSTGIQLKMQYSSSKGFYMVVPEGQSQHEWAKTRAAGASAAAAAPLGLPRSFLVLDKRGRHSTCVTTHELNALNSRLRDAAADCMMLTVQVLERLVERLLQQMPLLQRILDNLALLDLLLSFFQAVTGSEGDFCRPTLYKSGPLAITKGRHPLLQAINNPGFDCKPNGTYISSSSSLQLLTGPNMSGKSTYIKQVALLVVMAQIGCYIPATFMALSPYESLHTRIGTSDSIEANASSFTVEMTDMAHLLTRAGPRSLILIDELGRATSTCDGAALSWSMAEYLLALGAHVLLATHFSQLEELAAIYPGCKHWRMQVAVKDSDIHYKWSIAPAATDTRGGDNQADHYGILLARMAGLPDDITNRAMQVAQKLNAQQQQRKMTQQLGQDSSMQRLKQVYSLVHRLGCVARQAGVDGAQHGACADSDVQGAAAASSSTMNLGKADREAVQQCLPLVRALKLEAEKQLLDAAKQA